jgi:hypothetical protein
LQSKKQGQKLSTQNFFSPFLKTHCSLTRNALVQNQFYSGTVFSVTPAEKRTMKKYLLLRDNRQSGPHTIEQMGSIGLHPLDLIWIENESTSWKYPEEIEELKDFSRHDVSSLQSDHLPKKNEKVFISLPYNFTAKNRLHEDHEYSLLPVNEMEPVLETHYTKSLEDLKENYRHSKQKKTIWEKRILPSANAASVIAVFLGVMLGAFIIKKWVDGYEPVPEETAMAIPAIDREAVKQPEENIQNALVTEIVPVYKNTPAVKKTKKINVKNQLKLSNNKYKVGLFGGINGLQLTVFNTSAQVVDRVIVAVDYLRPNGAVVQSENVAFTSIKPKGAQTISIPGSNRGVKVQYKILKVFAHDYKADLKQI